MTTIKVGVLTRRTFALLLIAVGASLSVAGLTSASEEAEPLVPSPSSPSAPRPFWQHVALGTESPALVRVAADGPMLDIRQLVRTSTRRATTPAASASRRVRLDGPGELVLEGRLVLRSAGNWTVLIDRVSGNLAGVRPGSATGSLRSVNGVVTSDVRIDLPAHPPVAPRWHQRAAVDVSYDASGDLVGRVSVLTRSGPDAIALTGRVGADGSYRLDATGGVSFAGTRVPLAGVYHAAPGRAPRWNITGSAPSGELAGTPVRTIELALAHDRPGITGQAMLLLDADATGSDATRLGVPTTIDYTAAQRWTLTAVTSDIADTSSSRVPGLTIRGSGVSGQLMSRAGSITWSLDAPITLDTNGFAFTGRVKFVGASRSVLLVEGGSGSILGGPATSMSGAISLRRSSLYGTIRVAGRGSLGIELPRGWDNTASLRMGFAERNGALSTTVDVDYRLIRGRSNIKLTGRIVPGRPFELQVGGQATLHETAIPFRGTYRSAGFMVNGTPLTAPDYDIRGDIATANGGMGVRIPGGARFIGGELGLTRPVPVPPAAVMQAEKLNLASNEVTMSGTTTMQLADNNTFTLTMTTVYVDEDNWTATATTSGGYPFSPVNMTNLTIDPNTFRGTVSETAGVVSWNMTIDSVVWNDVTTGVTIETGFVMSNECPLEQNCPPADPDNVFIGFTNAALTFPSPVPFMSAEGAFLTDGSWARFNAYPDDVTFNGIGMTNTSLTMWKGSRSDEFSADLEMPDLSSQNNGFGVEFCGTFTVPIPDVTTLETGGCTEWTPDGIVIAQINTDGDVDSQPSNGVDLTSTTIDGFAWTDLSAAVLGFQPEVVMNGVELALEQDLNQLTATMVVPGALMKATGGPSVETALTATGWYSDGDFSLDATIPVNMRSGGFTLESVSVHIGKESRTFSLGLGADATVSMGGNHFPVTAYVGVAAGGGNSEIVVRVSAKGAVSADSSGGFDQPSFLPTGNFEPEDSDVVDGTFDAKQSRSQVPDGGFENASDGGNLLSNSQFENGISANMVTNGDFEDGTTTNLLGNADLEATDVVPNGDFERGDLGYWGLFAPYSGTIVTDSSPSNPGSKAVSVKNNSSNDSYASGLYQVISYVPIDNGKYEVSVWAKSTNGAQFRVYVSLQGQGPGCPAPPNNADSSQAFTTTTSWKQFTFPVTGTGCHAHWQIFLNPIGIGNTVTFDDMQLTTISLPGNAATVNVPNQPIPQVVQTFEADAGVSTNGGSYFYDNAVGNPGRSLASTGSNGAFNFGTNSWGTVPGNFDMSYDVFFPNSGARDLSHFGFWLSGSAGSQSGFAFRMQSATGNNADSGFWTASNGSTGSRLSQPSFGRVDRNTWYTVRLYTTTSGTTSYANAEVRKSSDGSVVWTAYNVVLPTGNRSGVFGEVKGGGASEGHRYDNIRITSGVYGLPGVFRGSAARSGAQFVSTVPGTGNWELSSSTQETPDVGAVYTYSAWVRSGGSNFTAQIGLDTVGGVYESNTATINVTSAWQRFSVSLLVSHGGHTDLRPFLRNLGLNGNTEVKIDDQLLQKVNRWNTAPYGGCSTTNRAMWVDQDTSSARSGSGGISLVDYAGCGQMFYQDLTQPLQQNGTYTLSGWFRSTSPVTVQINLEAFGGTYQAGTRAVFTTSSTWTQYTFPMRLNNSNNTTMRVRLDIREGSAGRVLQVDDITLVPTNVTVPQVPEDQWGTSVMPFDTMPTTSAISGNVSIVSDFGNPGNSLRSDGRGPFWYFGGPSFGSVSGDFDVSTDLYFTDSTARDIANLGFWITNPGSAPTGYMFRAQTINGESGFYSVNNGSWTRLSGNADGPLDANTWYRVRLTAVGSSVTGIVTRLRDNAVVSSRTLTMPPGNRSGVFGQVGDGAGSSTGHRWDNFTIYQGDTAAVWNDQPNAYSGSGYMQLDGSAGTGRAARTVAVNAVSGQTYTASAWVRAASGSATGRITLAAGSLNASTSFTATGSWQQVSVDLPLTASSSTLTMTMQDDAGGGKLNVDDVNLSLQGLTQTLPWSTFSSNNSFVSTGVWSDPAQARTGDNYLAAQVSNFGDVVYLDMPSSSTITPGSVWVASAWVRTTSGTMTGSMGLWGLGGTNESQFAPYGFTATTTWQQFFTTLTVVNANHTHFRVEFDIATTGKQLLIDDVELVPMETWTLNQPSGVNVHQLQVNDPSNAASGPGHLRVISTGANGGVGATSNTTVTQGSTYVMEGYVRSLTGSNVNGSFTLTASGSGATNSTSASFTATNEWQYVVVNLTAANNNTQLRGDVLLGSAGDIAVDQISIYPDIIAQADPWIADSGVTATVKDKPDLAHDGNGLMMMQASTSGTGIRHDVTTNPSQNSVWDVTAWVRSSDGTPISGKVQLSATGGSSATQTVEQPFTTDGAGWQLVTFRMTVANSGRTMLGAKVVLTTTGRTLYVDDIIVQQAGPWTAGGSATIAQTGDADGAESGSGYLKVTKNSIDDAWTERTTSGTVGQDTTQIVQVWVRSVRGDAVRGRVTLTAQGGSAPASTSTTNFTADGTWQKVSASVVVAGSSQAALLTRVYVDTEGAPLAIDTVTIGQAPLDQDPDGVTEPLPHPERGYTYLWDDAFGIPGAHLWALTAQIQVTPSGAGLGVGGTLYFDPSKMPSILVGNDWLKADMTLNISRTDPCLAFGFDATDSDVAVQIDGGVFSTKQFQISFAPRGCEVGDYVVPQGASIGFNTQLGDANFFLNLSITKGDEGPEFHSAIGLSNLSFGGFTYNQMELKIDVTTTSQETSFIGDFELPMGKFYGAFDLETSTDGIRSTGQVNITDWQMAGGTFDVSSFNYYQDMNVPTGGCGSFNSESSGQMSLGSKNYAFTGIINMSCGELRVLHFGFQYWKGGVSFAYSIDYDSTSKVLAGNLRFEFDRRVSWKYFGIRRTRHPKFMINLAFRMPVDNPSAASLTLAGSVSVSGGSGRVDCAFGGSNSDDGCSLQVTINVFGGTSYSSTW
ncbi:MAG: Carbohydrate binding domain [Actinomycetota bacterium]